MVLGFQNSRGSSGSRGSMVLGFQIGTRRLCSLIYLLCYAALPKNLPIMLKLMLNIYLLCSIFLPQFPCFSNNFAFYGKAVSG